MKKVDPHYDIPARDAIRNSNIYHFHVLFHITLQMRLILCSMCNYKVLYPQAAQL